MLEALADSDATPEDLCASCPELLPVIQARWRQMCRIQAELDALFPTQAAPSAQPIASRAGDIPLPAISGYEIESVLGVGGMGAVFRARHVRLNRVVALKMALAGAYAGPGERSRFQREAEAVAALRHPNVVQIHDVGEAAGRPYFTMEYVEGGSLAQKLAGTPQPAREAAALLATLARAVQAAHDSGIVHRDLKPANVLLTADGAPKIGDFGLARRLSGEVGEAGEAGVTRTGTAVGTPSYMAPEQARGQAGTVGPAADVYALGAILYECLTSRPPFRAETATDTLLQVVS
jgi:serine/threonine-protein kinase